MGFELLQTNDKLLVDDIFYGNILLTKLKRKSKSNYRKKIQKLKQTFPSLKVLVLLKEPSNELVLSAISSGADGYLTQNISDRNLLEALQECWEGSCPMTAEISQRVVNLLKKLIPENKKDYGLTKRELEILQLLVEGADTTTIAEQLFISIQTVRNHIKHIYVKLHVHSKSQAVVKAIRKGLVV